LLIKLSLRAWLLANAIDAVRISLAQPPLPPSPHWSGAAAVAPVPRRRSSDPAGKARVSCAFWGAEAVDLGACRSRWRRRRRPALPHRVHAPLWQARGVGVGRGRLVVRRLHPDRSPTSRRAAPEVPSPPDLGSGRAWPPPIVESWQSRGATSSSVPAHGAAGVGSRGSWSSWSHVCPPLVTARHTPGRGFGARGRGRGKKGRLKRHAATITEEEPSCLRFASSTSSLVRCKTWHRVPLTSFRRSDPVRILVQDDI
jgi:hypothetical protein